MAVVFTVGEEGLGGLRGARHACRELAPEAVLALEGHGCDRVFTDAVGSLRVRLTVTGPGGHSWWDRGRPSAVHELTGLLHAMIASVPAPLTVNVGLVEGGSGVNAIAARASATVEWRATDQAALDRQEAALAGLGPAAAAGPGVGLGPVTAAGPGAGLGPAAAAGLRLSVERLDRRAGSLPVTHPLVAAVLRARSSIGLPLTTADGSTDANAALAAGIPAVALGCCQGEDMHAPTERIRADSIATGAAQLRAVLAESWPPSRPVPSALTGAHRPHETEELTVLRTGKDYIESLRDGREVWIDGEQVQDVPTHPAFAPVVNVRARIYDLAREAGTKDLLTYVDEETAERCATTSRPPRSREDWRAKRASVDAILDDAGGVVTRVGDETVGEMWSLFDGQDVLNEIDPAFSANITGHVRRAQLLDPFHVSANTDPKGNRSLRPQEQDPDVLLHVVGETDNGIVVRGAKFETAAAYANQAFVKPTIGEWNNEVLSDYAVGFLADMGAPGIKHICRSPFAAQHSPDDYPLTSRYDEIDTMIVFDDVEIPWENVFFYRHTRAAAFIRTCLHRYSIFPYVQRYARFADFLLGVAYASARSTGVTMHQAVREKIAQIACYREGINAHLTAAVELAEPSPGGLLMPNQPMMYAGRVFASTQLPAVMHLVRDLCGCQVSLMPSKAMFDAPGGGDWLRKYFTIGEIPAEERRKLFALARDLLNSDYAGHRLTFQLFAQSPPFSHLLAVYNNYDFSGPLDVVARYSGVADAVRK